jgi:broad specificity phosphatase PhoE
MPRQILLVRHCQSRANADGRLEGRGDSPLSERGREQARRLAAVMASRDIGPATLP